MFLPAPLKRYLDHVIRDGRILRKAHLTQAGELRFSKDKKWIPFEAHQEITALPREFVWDAKVKIAPFVKLQVLDAYRSGTAFSELKILFPIYKERAGLELNAGALQRYLGECIWLPSALLPGNGLEWSSIYDRTASATLADHTTKVSLNFHFNQKNEVSCVSTPGRYRKVKGKFEITPWKAITSNYEEKSGVLIPVRVEVEWELPEGSFLWFRANILDFKYESE